MTAQPGGMPRQDTDILAQAENGTFAGQWTLVSGQSTVEFANRHFWNAMTVRGRFEQVSGEGTVGPDGTVTGQLVIDAASLTTGNNQRDKHLRSADFFDVEKHPRVVLSITRARLSDAATLNVEGMLEATGVAEPVSLTASVVTASPDEVTLRGELDIDRGKFGMTWSPLRMSSMRASGSATMTFRRVAAS